MKRLICSLVLCSLFCWPSARAEEVSIGALVQEAAAHNPELGFYRAEIAAARADKKSAGARPNPEAEFELGRKQSRPRSGGLSEEGAAWAVSVAQTFDWPNRLALRKAIANRQIELAELGLARFQRELENEVRRAAFKLLVAQQRQEAAAQVAQRGEELIATIVQRESAGPSPLLETRILEANVVALKRRAREAAKEAESALLALNQLRGQPMSTPLDIAPVSLRFPTLNEKDTYIAAALTNSFEIRAKVVELEQQGLRIDLARNERFPSFTVRPFYTSETAADREQTAGVAVSIPLPLWNRNKGAIEAARSRETQAQAALLVLQRDVERQARESLAHYAIDQKEIGAWRGGATQELQEAAELADRHYRLGSVTVAMYVEMQEKYLEGLQTMLETQFDALTALQAIERLTGLPFGNVVNSEPNAP